MANNFDKRAEEALYKAQTELAHVTRVATLGEMKLYLKSSPWRAAKRNGVACRCRLN